MPKTGENDYFRTYTVGYILFHSIFPEIFVNPETDFLTLKNSFFTWLDNKNLQDLEKFFCLLCLSAAGQTENNQTNMSSDEGKDLLLKALFPLIASLLQYTVIELKNKTRIYVWKPPEPTFPAEPYYIAIVLLPSRTKSTSSMIRYITLESSFFGNMLCEWVKEGTGKCHLNYGDCENDKNVFLERVINIIKQKPESIKSISEFDLLKSSDEDIS